MATEPVDLTNTWLDIKADQSLNETSTYLIQNTGGSAIYLNEAATEPAATAEGFIIRSTETWSFTVGPSGIWVRSDDDAGEVTINEG